MPTYPSSWSSLNVALSHDWLNGMRGGERVLELLCQGFPGAPVYTLLHEAGKVSEPIERHRIHHSFIQGFPAVYQRYRYYLPLFPRAVERFKLDPADLVISTSHCVAKGLRPPSGARHLCYCFTPMRYAWTFYEEYFGTNPVKKLFLKPTLAGLRRWDRRVSDRVDLFVAISEHVRERIERCYGREAEVVYPPVDTERCTPGTDGPDDFDLIVSALVPYKKIDLAVEAYNRLGTPLKIVGTGTEHDRLRRVAGSNIEFLGWQSDEAIVALYRRCRALVFPGEEDFGIVPLEAQACGRPVVAFGKGGALETIVDGDTGVFFPEQTASHLMEAVQRCASTAWNPATIRRHAERFGEQAFIDGLARCIERVRA